MKRRLMCWLCLPDGDSVSTCPLAPPDLGPRGCGMGLRLRLQVSAGTPLAFVALSQAPGTSR